MVTFCDEPTNSLLHSSPHPGYLKLFIFPGKFRSNLPRRYGDAPSRWSEPRKINFPAEMEGKGSSRRERVSYDGIGCAGG